MKYIKPKSMKKAIFMYGLLLSVIAGVFYACQKQKQFILPSDNSNAAQIQQGLSSSSASNNSSELPEIPPEIREKMHELRMWLVNLPLNQQMRIFDVILTDSERFGIWRDKWDQVMAVQFFTTLQRQHLKKIDNLLIRELYNQNGKEYIFFTTQYSDIWGKKAINLFDTDLFVLITQRLEDVVLEAKPKPMTGGGGGGGKADCNSTSFFSTCTNCCACTVGACGCVTTSWCCGFLWLFECDGICLDSKI